MKCEDEFYDKILEKFLECKKSKEKSDLWKSQTIIQLMENIKQKNNKEFVKNALLVLMSLEEDFLRDSFHIKSKDFSILSKEEKTILSSLLKEEASK
ncbi:MAG: hypothetical protein GF383_00150 [Candidatus Lokiarchaeota archaeon]|nr:hypothetical protein [Candidatus Lokiarchaeota archaeon]MBD3337505.1 hypothetical protein [Candidatus Lokiarchaeota archaeon]